jgi:putative addiction module component (TIGR02574 family)
LKVAQAFKPGITINKEASSALAGDRILPFIHPRFTITAMSQALPLPPPGFDALSIDEQIDYVQTLWDHIAAKAEDVPVPDWHREILAERLASHDASRDQGQEWEAFEKDLTAELSERTS